MRADLGSRGNLNLNKNRWRRRGQFQALGLRSRRTYYGHPLHVSVLELEKLFTGQGDGAAKQGLHLFTDPILFPLQPNPTSMNKVAMGLLLLATKYFKEETL